MREDPLKPPGSGRSVHIVGAADLIDAATFDDVQSHQDTVFVRDAGDCAPQSLLVHSVESRVGQIRFGVERLLDEPLFQFRFSI
jgi:hypothetical protein